MHATVVTSLVSATLCARAPYLLCGSLLEKLYPENFLTAAEAHDEENLLPYLLTPHSITTLTTEQNWPLGPAVFSAGFTTDHVLLGRYHPRFHELPTVKAVRTKSQGLVDVTMRLADIVSRSLSDLNPPDWINKDNVVSVASLLALMMTKAETMARYLGTLEAERGVPPTFAQMIGNPDAGAGAKMRIVENIAFSPRLWDGTRIA